MDKLHSESMDKLFEGILTLENIDECYAFFEDICTIKELFEMAQRFEVARMLKKGESYAVISKETGASTATISRVNKCLSYGSDGYQTVLKRLNSEVK